MIANVSAHRRADAFAQALEQELPRDGVAEDGSARRSEASGRPEDERLLTVARSLEAVQKPELSQEARAVQRARLIAAMEAQFASGEAVRGDTPRLPAQRAPRRSHRAARSLSRLRPRSRLTKSLAAGGLTVGVAAGAFGGVAAASSNALPGDTLYHLKRGMEDIRLGLTDDDSDRGMLYLDQASTRMMEARRLMERGRSGHLDHEALGEIRGALSGVTHDASEGHRLLHAAYQKDGGLGPIQALSTFTQQHRRSWDRLRESLPVQLTDVSRDVSSVFDAIDEEVGPLRSLLPKAPGRQQDTPGSSAPSAAPRSGSSSEGNASDSSQQPRQRHGHAAQPSAGPSEEQGLLGGAGDLLNPPSAHDSAAPSTGEAGESAGRGNSSAKPDITLPPLLPGLLPGLGIGAAEDDQG
ncbi:DUF5667 domain-containing protein [Streptomyces sp. NPDC059740]|uniref:DUF5667 domain-containing protein n=1 Tax=Streptomyces sp. NPDC059740 TaxID=3346926 RepID=UPI0036675E01